MGFLYALGSICIDFCYNIGNSVIVILCNWSKTILDDILMCLFHSKWDIWHLVIIEVVKILENGLVGVVLKGNASITSMFFQKVLSFHPVFVF